MLKCKLVLDESVLSTLHRGGEGQNAYRVKFPKPATKVVGTLLFYNCIFNSLQVCNNTLDRFHADTMLEKYATETIMNLLTFFFNSPFSDSSTTIKVLNFIQLQAQQRNA